MNEEPKENWRTLDLAGIKIDYLPWKYLPMKNKIAIVLGFGTMTVAGILMLIGY